MKFNKLLP